MIYPKTKSKSFLLTKVKLVESTREDGSDDMVGPSALMERQGKVYRYLVSMVQVDAEPAATFRC